MWGNPVVAFLPESPICLAVYVNEENWRIEKGCPSPVRARRFAPARGPPFPNRALRALREGSYRNDRTRGDARRSIQKVVQEDHRPPLWDALIEQRHALIRENVQRYPCHLREAFEAIHVHAQRRSGGKASYSLRRR